ncbi:MAG: hypothetical protein ACK4OP_00395, partial [Gemmobacter sp.]
MLRDNRFGPFARDVGRGPNYHEDVAAEVAMIGAAMWAGFTIAQASAIVRAALASLASGGAATFCDVRRFGGDHAQARGSYLAAFAALASTRLEDLRAPHDDDALILLADREWLLTAHRSGLRTLAPRGADPDGPVPLGRLASETARSDLVFTPLVDELGGGFGGPAEAAAWIAYQRAAREAATLTTLNLNLAARRAFAAIL